MVKFRKTSSEHCWKVWGRDPLFLSPGGHQGNVHSCKSSFRVKAVCVHGTHCCGLNWIPQKFKYEPPLPVMTLFGKRVFADKVILEEGGP